jgi:hypothetical protein
VFYGHETYCVYEFGVSVMIMWCECDNYVNLYYICDDYVNMKTIYKFKLGFFIFKP